MRLLLRLFAVIFAVTLLLGNTNCTQTGNSGAPDFVTTLTIENSSNQQNTTFSQNTPIQFALTIRNRSDIRQTLFFNTAEQANFAVVQAGTANVVWNCDNTTNTTAACSLTPAPSASSIGLAAGASTTITATWNQTDNSGTQLAARNYEVMGGFTVFNTTGLGDAAANSDSMVTGAPTAAQLFPTVYRSVLLPFTIVTAP